MNLLLTLYKWVRKRCLGIDDRSPLEIAIANGLSIGSDVTIMGNVIIDPGHCWLIEIGNSVTIAPRVHILAHDASTKRELGYTKIAKTTIGNNVFIGAGSIVLPGVSIGDRVIIGAGSVVSRSIPANSVAAGNPACVLCSYDTYMEKHRLAIQDSPVFDDSYRIDAITPSKRETMKKALKDHSGYIV